MLYSLILIQIISFINYLSNFLQVLQWKQEQNTKDRDKNKNRCNLLCAGITTIFAYMSVKGGIIY